MYDGDILKDEIFFDIENQDYHWNDCEDCYDEDYNNEEECNSGGIEITGF